MFASASVGKQRSRWTNWAVRQATIADNSSRSLKLHLVWESLLAAKSARFWGSPWHLYAASNSDVSMLHPGSRVLHTIKCDAGSMVVPNLSRSRRDEVVDFQAAWTKLCSPCFQEVWPGICEILGFVLKQLLVNCFCSQPAGV